MAEKIKSNMRIEIKATLVSLPASLFVLGLAFGLAPLLQSSELNSKQELPSRSSAMKTVPDAVAKSTEGQDLFARNCAHCHGDDARGDEGPSLYNLAMSDARIAKRIKDGIKGEMPRFAAKLNDLQISEITAYLRTLRN